MKGHGMGKFYGENFAGAVGGLDVDMTTKEANSVLEMNEGVAIGEFGEV